MYFQQKEGVRKKEKGQYTTFVSIFTKKSQEIRTFRFKIKLLARICKKVKKCQQFLELKVLIYLVTCIII